MPIPMSLINDIMIYYAWHRSLLFNIIPREYLLSYCLSLSTPTPWILILGTLNTPQKNLLNKNDALNIAFILSIKVTLTSLITTLFLYLNIIYKRPILIAIYCINLPVTIFDFYLILVLYLISTTYKDKVTTNIL